MKPSKSLAKGARSENSEKKRLRKIPLTHPCWKLEGRTFSPLNQRDLSYVVCQLSRYSDQKTAGIVINVFLYKFSISDCSQSLTASCWQQLETLCWLNLSSVVFGRKDESTKESGYFEPCTVHPYDY